MEEKKPCGLLIKQINDALERRANNELRSDGLTLVQAGALFALSKLPGQEASMKDLEKILHVAQSTTAGIIARLEQKGLVESFGDMQDKRIKMVRITVCGLDCCKKGYEHMADTERNLLSGLTELEANMFKELLQKVCSYMK